MSPPPLFGIGGCYGIRPRNGQGAHTRRFRMSMLALIIAYLTFATNAIAIVYTWWLLFRVMKEPWYPEGFWDNFFPKYGKALLPFFFLFGLALALMIAAVVLAGPTAIHIHR
jgi:hypothetical protein